MLDTIATVVLFALLAAAMAGHVAVLLAVKARVAGFRRQQTDLSDLRQPAAAAPPDAAFGMTPAQPH